ncbi:MAG: putative sugar nucleotidyl transferase [Ferruginibacter sp.]
MAIFLDESSCRNDLYPFTHTRHTADIRIGILTIKEKWVALGEEVFTTNENGTGHNLVSIMANVLPTRENYKAIIESSKNNTPLPYSDEIKILSYPWQISQFNDWAIRKDFQLLTANKRSAKLNPTNRFINPEDIFVEEGASIEYSIINASTGPVYIGSNTQIMEGNMIRGPFALCEGSVVKMGSKIYGGTTIGPWCVAGGEIKNSILFSYSNKAHDGYLGDSVIGEWCNLGAGTSNSNIKNSGGDIVYIREENKVNAGSKAGLLMGDYSRAAINTSFNTGTIVGVCCNIFGRDFPLRETKNFTWGEQRYELEKALRDIENWKKLKNKTLTEQEIKLLNQLYLSNQ